MNVRLFELREIVENQVVDVNDLVGLLELTIEDILDNHTTALIENAHKFGVTSSDE